MEAECGKLVDVDGIVMRCAYCWEQQSRAPWKKKQEQFSVLLARAKSLRFVVYYVIFSIAARSLRA